MSDTPETDSECFVAEGPFVTDDFARKLERERNEWQQAAEQHAADAHSLAIQLNHFHPADDTAIEVGKERDEWRAVAEKLHNALLHWEFGPDGPECCEELQPILAEFDKLKQEAKSK
jgi:hypothetical protein